MHLSHILPSLSISCLNFIAYYSALIPAQRQCKSLHCIAFLSLLTMNARQAFCVTPGVPLFRHVPSGSTFCSRRAVRTLHRGVTSGRCITMLSTVEELKKATGYKAVDDYIQSGMVVGLGTGSTAYYAVERLGELLRTGALSDIVAIPTSERTRMQAESLSIPLVTLDTHPVLDVAIDGADEVDAELNLVKGRGGALLREKMVEMQSKKFVVIVDDTKLVKGLGISGAMPVEVTPFCWQFNLNRLRELESIKGCDAKLRMDDNGDKPYVTDNGGYIVDLYFKQPIKNPANAAQEISQLVGVVEHGLFLGMTTAVIVASKDGIEVKTPAGAVAV